MAATLRTRTPGRFIGRLVREPLVHFLLVGLAVFTLFELRTRVPEVPTELIEVTETRVSRLAGQFEAVWRRPPTPEETGFLVEDFVREEVYYREALALGLDQDDAVIRQRLRQKMEFLGGAGAAALTPDDAELQAYLDRHPEAFGRSAQVTFEQVFVGDEVPPAALAALEAGGDPEAIGRRSLLPATMNTAVETSVDGVFGEGFFAVVAELQPGEWRGPVQSAYGAHLVRLIELVPAVEPALEDVRERVEAEWRQQTAADLREAEYQALRERYTVQLPEPGETE